MARKIALIKVFDGDKLVDLIWNNSTAADSAPPNQVEKEFKRIFDEHKQLQAERRGFEEEIKRVRTANTQKLDRLYDLLCYECMQEAGLIDNECIYIYQELCESMVTWGRLKRKNRRMYLPVKP